jgi:hypothetical protein
MWRIHAYETSLFFNYMPLEVGWLAGGTSPVTNKTILNCNIVTNHAQLSAIKE